MRSVCVAHKVEQRIRSAAVRIGMSEDDNPELDYRVGQGVAWESPFFLPHADISRRKWAETNGRREEDFADEAH